MPRGSSGSHFSGGGRGSSGGGSHFSRGGSGGHHYQSDASVLFRPHYSPYYRRGSSFIYIGGAPYVHGANGSGYYNSMSEAMAALDSEGQAKLRKVKTLETINVLCRFFFLFAIFAFVICLILSSTSSFNPLKVIEDDYAYYHEMIDDAKYNANLRVDGYITQIKKNENMDKFYFKYYILTETGLKNEGYIYSVIDISEFENYAIGDVIEVAVNSYPVDFYTDHVPMIFENYDIEDDAEYDWAKSKSNTFTLVFVLVVVVGVALIATVITTSVFITKLASTLHEHRIDNKKSDSNEAKATKLKCRYCGSLADIGEHKCKNCGAVVDFMDK